MDLPRQHPEPARIVVAGWIALDYLIGLGGLLSAGDDVDVMQLEVACGGRGANQAMAVAALGLDVGLIGRVGDDEYADVLLEELIECGVDTRHVETSPDRTGIRFVHELDGGRRAVAAAPGANEYLSVDDFNRRIQAIGECSVFAISDELPGAVVRRALDIAREAGVPSVLSHRSGVQPSDALVAAADVLVVADFAGSGLIAPGLARERPREAVRVLSQRGAHTAILLAHDTVLVADQLSSRFVDAPQPIASEDATDAFIAGLLQGLAVDESIDQAVLRGVRAATLLVDH